MKYIMIGLERHISELVWNEIYKDWIRKKYIRIGLE